MHATWKRLVAEVETARKYEADWTLAIWLNHMRDQGLVDVSKYK